ncbi:short-subunit dehydrogenase [Aeromicrobium panaciterrae]|uniref:Short-subunit dehydrogenase n=1 Tax=Aeromicrobium panaciterrae TaxID=363861 RepID=A0ABU1ULS9_9ACTN|nr:SDR family NAD(P)-dependent oxidoreductase [Aeromicrobium panaciterrae]MDR7086126.1 short-subunit dehydrogenase [Aeromicrobium panaciterrae]
MTRQTIKGARALVTGATGGIGQEIARALHAEGAELVLSGRRAEILEPLAKELGAQVVIADLADLDDVARLLKEAGPLDILVANAALPASGLLLEYTQEQILRNVSVNLTVPILMARESAAGMSERGHGHIVLIGSVAGKAASAGASMYNATKFGLRGFSLALREDLASANVGVSIVEPGFVREAGMFIEADGKLPPGVRTVSPQQVAKKVVKAIKRNKGEVVVAPVELRAGTAVASVFPGVGSNVQKRLGGHKIFETMVEGQRAKR